MKPLLLAPCATLLLASLTLPAFTAGSPWDGTWKLNRHKSTFTGDTVRFAGDPAGIMHLITGIVDFDFACDGKEYPVFADRTFTCTKATDTTMDGTAKRGGGETLFTNHRELSADGKTMTSVTHGTNPDGSAYTTTTKYVRTEGSTGWIGTWKDVEHTSDSALIYIITLTGDSLHLERPVQKDVFEGRIDGSDNAVTGPTVPPGLTAAYRFYGPNRIHFVFKTSGRPYIEGDRILSPDGKTLTETNWVYSRPDEKQILVFDKQ